MKQLDLSLTPEEQIRSALSDSGIQPVSVERRDYPEETIFVIIVDELDIAHAREIGNELDQKLQQTGFKGFVTVRKSETSASQSGSSTKDGVNDPKVNALVDTLNARSRTSEFQPSLSYIPDTALNLNAVISSRHHLIFGRRGAGKTTLMVEAKRVIAERGDLAVWINLQTLRLESVSRAFVFVCQRLCEAMQGYFSQNQKSPHVLSLINVLATDLDRLVRSTDVSETEFARLVPRCQNILHRFTETSSRKTFVFIDELHYFDRAKQPALLDAIHGIVRDCDAWLKVAGIRHLSRWFQSNPPLGLQTGHDAVHIDLDITLESPSKAKDFLERILLSYARTVGISSLSRILMSDALDRLVLASGAVPRDYLVLSADAIRQAQKRERAKLVGVQDVNKAAGEAAKVKLAELEDDASSISVDGSSKLVTALHRIRSFCLDEKRYTFFRIDFRDKEQFTTEYSIIQDLMDLRLLHMIDSSLSDQREAGRRSEVYMIDLSQFSGQRLKKNLRALDFKEGHLVMKLTGTNTPARTGAKPNQRLGILRRAPVFTLSAGQMALPS